MPNGLFIPSAKTSRSCAPPVCCGSRSTTISPAPVSARKISPFGATVSQRGRLKFAANTFKRNPGGTVGRNPAGGFALSGPLPAELVANGAGSFGFWPCVTCAGTREGRDNVNAKAKMLRTCKAVSFQKNECGFAFYDALVGRPIPFAPLPDGDVGKPLASCRVTANLPSSSTHRSASNPAQEE